MALRAQRFQSSPDLEVWRYGVARHLASLLSRSAVQVRDKGLPGAVVQQGMTVMAHTRATLVHIRQQHLLGDALTSGGLLASVPPVAADRMIQVLHDNLIGERGNTSHSEHLLSASSAQTTHWGALKELKLASKLLKNYFRFPGQGTPDGQR